MIDTGVETFGVLLGDGVRVGANAVIREAPDGQICLFAEQAGYIIVTKDRDFLPAVLPVALQVLWVRTVIAAMTSCSSA